jgi:hypothetical protein
MKVKQDHTVAENDSENGPLVLKITVQNAKNLKGSKAALNSFVRAQFADFDYKDSAIINDSMNPEYGLTHELKFNVDEVLNF